MTVPRHASLVASLRAHLETLGEWARRGPVRALVTKLVLSVAGVGVFVVGIAMLVLPGPGLVVMAAGLGLLAAEWEWARRVVRTVSDGVRRARQALLPEGSSPRRKAAAGVLAGAFLVGGFLATTATTALLGAQTIL
ncbi:PGPGW domain-containing protein [Nocardioides euryhalodurans]|uniref:TIGR02611 family protein n=1 Tax=Nocardioides euryhalodurans TaxID=2518370 RepID=A0A4P7GL83_9ACTN|nr:PGPGW domain-containing protein [Nocardioides euryhalodurans]QBR92855.1 hypothetical protein EXE57_11635 [Nocardioides euryhalodurans]